MGRTKDIVLNGPEQLIATEARFKLRQNQKDMKLNIRQAKKAARLAVASLTGMCKDIQKATAEVGKQSQTSARFASKIVDDNLGKKPAAAASTQTHRASEKAQAICEGMINKLHALLEAMRTTLEQKSALCLAEEEFKTLEDAARNVQDQDEDEEEDEEDDGPNIDVHVVDEVASKYEDAQANVEEARKAAKSSQDHANDAELYSLLAAAKDAWIRAANPPTRSRGSGSRGRGRGISGFITSGGNATPLSLSPAAPIVA